MKSLHLLLALFLINLSVVAQNDSSTIQKEIDVTVWRSFQKAFETLDAVALNNNYATSVLRVTPQGIDTQNEFKESNLKRFASQKQNGDSIALDFWFDSRKTNTTTSYEVGFYRIKITSQKGSEQVLYGQFHIVLQKINDTWKITQDWDTTTIAGETITAKHFARNTPLRF